MIIKNDIKLQSFMTSKRLKEILKNAYELTGKVGTAKASDIENWYECKLTSKSINGKTNTGYEIYRSKLVFKQALHHLKKKVYVLLGINSELNQK